MKLTHLIRGFVFLSLVNSTLADVRLPNVLGSGMVLQRDLPVPVWGWADAGEKVTVAFGKQTKATVAGENGKWMVKLAPLKASAEPAKLVRYRIGFWVMVFMLVFVGLSYLLKKEYWRDVH